MAKKKAKTKSKSRAKARKAAPKKKSVKKGKAKASAPRLKPISGKPATLIVAAPQKRLVGKVTHFYNKISVGIIELTDSDLAVGDEISIEGPHTNFKQKVDSMQIDMKPIKIAVKGQEIGMKVKDRVREHDIVYKA